MRDFWETAVDSTINNIALHPYQRPDLTYLTQLDTNGNKMYLMDDYVSTHLVAKLPS